MSVKMLLKHVPSKQRKSISISESAVYDQRLPCSHEQSLSRTLSSNVWFTNDVHGSYMFALLKFHKSSILHGSHMFLPWKGIIQA